MVEEVEVAAATAEVAEVAEQALATSEILVVRHASNSN